MNGLIVQYRKESAGLVVVAFISPCNSATTKHESHPVPTALQQCRTLGPLVALDQLWPRQDHIYISGLNPNK